MFERFTDRARRAVILAVQEAREMNHGDVCTGHLLVALLAEGEGVAALALKAAGADLTGAREALLTRKPRGRMGVAGHLPFSPRLKRALEDALREALILGHTYIGTEHLLLGLIRPGEGSAAQVLDTLGITLPAVREEVMGLLEGYPEAELPRRSGPRRCEWLIPMTGESCRASAAFRVSQGRLHDAQDSCRRHLAATAGAFIQAGTKPVTVERIRSTDG